MTRHSVDGDGWTSLQEEWSRAEPSRREGRSRLAVAPREKSHPVAPPRRLRSGLAALLFSVLFLATLAGYLADVSLVVLAESGLALTAAVLFAAVLHWWESK